MSPETMDSNNTDTPASKENLVNNLRLIAADVEELQKAAQATGQFVCDNVWNWR